MAEVESPKQERSGRKTLLLVAALLYVFASFYIMFDLRSSLEAQQNALSTVTEEQQKLVQHLESTESNLKASDQALAEKLGVAQQELQARARSYKSSSGRRWPGW